MAYSFDSTALERAAKAARDLEKFPNAKEALELSRMQEITRQKEVDQQTKVFGCFHHAMCKLTAKFSKWKRKFNR